MSQLQAKLTEDMKNAMRAHDTLKLGVIRFLLSELKNFTIDNGEQDDAGVLKVISREMKKLQDAANDFKAGGRQDLVDENAAKIAIMQSYLPQQLSDEELKQMVQAVLTDMPGKNFGEIMKAVLAKTQGKADGARVSAMVKQCTTA